MGSDPAPCARTRSRVRAFCLLVVDLIRNGSLPPPLLFPPRSAKVPYTATVKSVQRIVGPKATGETCQIIIQTDGKMPYFEGQSYGVIPPGTKINAKGKEVPHSVRLYSIASTRYGEAFDGQTATLCVRRAVYFDPELNKEDPAKKVRGAAWMAWPPRVGAARRRRTALGSPHPPRTRLPFVPSHPIPMRRVSAPTSCVTPSPAIRSR